ncbi:Alpha/Beta hydrolase protein [Crucibulum laeve]|uniref:Alpha/Beta hydrolase protein n=1 Tax=Crucibulum laeve TaxID=68775 RepID=A0A5C3MA77_9AGAR|nr:Alpha/Beta hydrolase protein [Crucibulum laeve]
MPYIKVKTTSGLVNFHYTISTPTCTSAQAINPSLPTIIFLHPVYIPQAIFQPQFSDPKLRRFNLIAIDSRCHGETTGSVPSTFRRLEAAEDLLKFMEALRLPPCHLFGMSMGACIALQAAVSHPQRILSCCMVSPLPLVEPVDVAEGRQEIYDCYVAAFKDPEALDEVAILDSVCGAVQLGFSGQDSKLIAALVKHALPQVLKQWTPDRFDEVHTVAVKFFCDRHPHPRSSLEKVVSPIRLIHCGGDIAYPFNYAEELQQALEDAGVDVELSQVAEAPHFGSVTHSIEINAILHDFVLEQTKSPIPPAQPEVTSPFESALVEAGWRQDDDSSDEDEDFI